MQVGTVARLERNRTGSFRVLSSWIGLVENREAGAEFEDKATSRIYEISNYFQLVINFINQLIY